MSMETVPPLEMSFQKRQPFILMWEIGDPAVGKMVTEDPLAMQTKDLLKSSFYHQVKANQSLEINS